MKYNTREFEIAWQGLKLGIHEYEYNLDKHFLLAKGDKEAEEMKDFNAKVRVKFDKHPNFFMLHVDIDGKAIVACDRCGDDYEMVLWDEFDLIIKLTNEGETPEEDEADVAFVPWSETVLDISDWIYEFVVLSMPIQRIHPNNANGESACNPKVIEILNNLSVSEDEPQNDIWKGLEAFKSKNNKQKPNKN